MRTMHAILNPFSANLAWLWDLIALLITFAVIQALVIVNGILQKLACRPPTSPARSSTSLRPRSSSLAALQRQRAQHCCHVGAAGFHRFSLRPSALGLPQKTKPSINSMCAQRVPRELLGGTLHYAIIMLVCTILFFNAGDLDSPASVQTLAGSDELADIVGRRYGGTHLRRGRRAEDACRFARHVWRLRAAHRGADAHFGTGFNLVAIAVLAFFATVVEAVSPKAGRSYTIAAAVFLGIACS
ncbi:MAG: hypothetical protein R2838_09145 [Caldilineaceae bacterium]